MNKMTFIKLKNRFLYKTIFFYSMIDNKNDEIKKICD